MSARDVRLANHHAGTIILPRGYNPNTSGDPAAMKLQFDSITILPGQVKDISAVEWAIRKQSQALQYYLDHGHLTLVKCGNEVDIETGSTADLEVPEHLQSDEDGTVTVQSATGDGSSVQANLRRKSKGTVTV